MARHSFIQMSKLTNLKGRISYISSHARQENLYAVYETAEPKFWNELAKCNQEEFKKSGTEGKCIEARELIIALPESFVEYEPNMLLKLFAEHFKQKYGVEAIGALHHNKQKTNYHIHLIFSERKLLEKPIEKVATRNMFYDEEGRHVRTKKEILDEDGQLKNSCKIIPKGDVYERKIFTPKDARFKSELFLKEVKTSFTHLINLYVKDEKEQLKVFDKHGVYLPMKKIGKNNPKAEQMQSDNQLRQNWNQTVDRALLGGVPETQIMNIKKMEISEKVKTLIRKEGKCPQLFGGVMKLAITILQILVAKVLTAVNLKGKTEQQWSHQPIEQKNSGHMLPSPPQMSELAQKYPRLETIFQNLNKQNHIIHQKEQKRMGLQSELKGIKGMFKGKQRKALQETIEDLSLQIESTKQHLSNMVRDYGYKNMKEFLQDYNAAQIDFNSYQKAVKDRKDSIQMKPEPISIRERLEINKQRLKEADTKKKQKRSQTRDRGAR